MGPGAKSKMAKSLEWQLNRAEYYKRFYEEGAGLSSSFERDAETKKKLLIKYFPLRFGPGGKQDLRKYEAISIGAIFNHLYNAAKKYKQ